MGDVTLEAGILDQVQSLVIDASQVVSYKWLSRNFSISSNTAKRILQQFAKQNERNKVEVVYAVCGWSKGEPRTYNVQLVPKVKLQEAKQGFDGSASQHVYSVQPCLPKDPAQLFSAEYVQSQELFMQPPGVDNCLRDNRFSSVSYSHVTRSVGGSKSVINQQKAEPSSSVPPSSKNVDGFITPKPEPLALQLAPPNSGGQEAAVKNTVRGVVVKEESSGNISTTVGLPSKAVTENVATGKKKVGATGGGSSLANLWGKAPAKVKVITPSESAAKPALITGDAEAGILAMEGDGSEPSSDEEASDFARIRRCQGKNGKGRKRQVVFDEELSEDEDVMNSQVVINLASPEPFKKKAQLKTEESQIMHLEVKVDPAGPIKMEIDEKRESIDYPHSDIASVTEKSCKPVESSGGVKREAESGSGPGASAKPLPGPKRKKVLKTRINERGKEGTQNEKSSPDSVGSLTEVVWETDGVEETPEGKPAFVPDKVSAPPVASKMPAERPPAPAKAPQKTITKAPGKAGGKAASKGQGAAQGNLLSFFKKKT